MSSVLVFDDQPKGVLEWDPDEASVAVGGSDASVLVFDPPGDTEIVDAPDGPTGALVLDAVQTDVLIGDPNPVTTVVEPDDHPDVVVLDDEGLEVIVVSPQGPRGAQGADGDGKYDDMEDLTVIFENGLI